MYHPKGYDEKDDLQALLFLHLGGAHIIDITHHIFGTSSAWTIHTHTTVPHIIPSPSFPTSNEIQCNIEASFKGLLDGISISGQKMLRADYAYLSSTYVDKDQYKGQYLPGTVG